MNLIERWYSVSHKVPGLNVPASVHLLVAFGTPLCLRSMEIITLALLYRVIIRITEIMYVKCCQNVCCSHILNIPTGVCWVEVDFNGRLIGEKSATVSFFFFLSFLQLECTKYNHVLKLRSWFWAFQPGTPSENDKLSETPSPQEVITWSEVTSQCDITVTVMTLTITVTSLLCRSSSMSTWK